MFHEIRPALQYELNLSYDLRLNDILIGEYELIWCPK